MPFVLPLLLLIVILEIAILVLSLSKLGIGRLNEPVASAITVSLIATFVSWMLPLEGLLGATMRSGWFEPWTYPWVIGFWAFIAVPISIFFVQKRFK